MQYDDGDFNSSLVTLNPQNFRIWLMQITWEMILHIYKDAIPVGYINCDIDKNYTLVWTRKDGKNLELNI